MGCVNEPLDHNAISNIHHITHDSFSFLLLCQINVLTRPRGGCRSQPAYILYLYRNIYHFLWNFIKILLTHKRETWVRVVLILFYVISNSGATTQPSLTIVQWAVTHAASWSPTTTRRSFIVSAAIIINKKWETRKKRKDTAHHTANEEEMSLKTKKKDVMIFFRLASFFGHSNL